MKLLGKAIALVAALTAFAPSARAEVGEVKIAWQTAFTYLQLNVMRHENLIEKQAAALGMPNLKVTWAQFSGNAQMNDALLSGAVDFVCGGVPGLLTLWDRALGTPNEVRGVSAMGYFDLFLNTRNPAIKSIKDFKDSDRIPMAAVKVGGQALILQMAAAKEWGIENWEKLDKLTFAMSPPDQTAAMLANNESVVHSFASPPFQLIQLKNPAVHTILKSSDMVGNATSAIWWASKRFHDANPTVYKAVLNAVKDAQAIIDKDLRKAVTYYVEDAKSSASVDEVMDMLNKPGYGYHIAPQGIMLYADFMNKTGRLKNKPASWKDLFFPEIHDLNGS